MSYGDFIYGSAGTSGGGITSWDILTLRVHGVDNPGNLFLRVTGIAQAMQGDPPWGDEPPVLRGVLAIQTDQILDPEDKLVSACATAGFGRMDRDENFGSNDDFSIAIDEVALVQISNGTINIVVHAAYQGDTIIPAITFSADLLIYRATLQELTSHPRWPILKKEVRYTITTTPHDLTRQ
jgi:hypothetical protein